jgi:hypothetical protein
VSTTIDTTNGKCWFVAVGGMSRLVSGKVFLQQSSAFAPGWQSPLRQQAAASRVRTPLVKQSNGAMTATTANSVTAM